MKQVDVTSAPPDTPLVAQAPRVIARLKTGPQATLPAVLRLAALVGFCAAQILAPWGGDAFVLAGLATLLALDTTRPHAVVNIMATYTFLIFQVGPAFVPVVDPVRVGSVGAWMSLAILTGAGIGRALRDRAAVDTPPPVMVEALAPGRGDISVTILRVVVVVQLLLVALNVMRYGVGGYLAGSSLVGGIESYGSRGLGLLDVVSLIARSLALWAVCFHASINLFRPGAQVRWKLVLVVLVVVPVISLSRSQLFSSAFVLAFLLTSARFRRRSPRRRRLPTGVLVGCTVLVVLTVSLTLGVVRENALGQRGGTARNVAVSEFSPITVVSAGVDPANQAYGGREVLEPLVFRFVPRRLYPAKPDNTTARFMKSYAPSAFASGFSLAPTLFGAFLLNFGVGTTVLLALLLALAVAGLVDRSRLNSPRSFAICGLVYANSYALLRNDPSNSIAELAVAIAAMMLAVSLIGSVRQRPPQ